jgi:hypothetical protein
VKNDCGGWMVDVDDDVCDGSGMRNGGKTSGAAAP